MIDIRELRVGNYVKDRGDKILRIDYFEIDKVCQEMEVANMKVHPLTEYVEYLEPVPVTEELLLKCGFEKINHVSGYIFFTLKKNKKIKGIDIYKDYTIIGNGTSIKHIRNLHTLQNIYFDLNGEELEVNICD